MIEKILSEQERDKLGCESRDLWLEYNTEHVADFMSEYIKEWKDLDEADRESYRVAAEAIYLRGYKDAKSPD